MGNFSDHRCYSACAHLVGVGVDFSELNQPVTSSQFVQIYLQTNIAKYLPGNVWHYGRISAAVKAGVSGSAATLSVLLEPLLMAAAASNGLTRYPVCSTEQPLSMLGLTTVPWRFIPGFKQSNSVSRPVKVTKRQYGGVHPLSASSSAVDTSAFGLVRYPPRPLLGELGFRTPWRWFLLTLLALKPLELSQIPLLLGAFSFAWLLGNCSRCAWWFGCL